MHLAYTGTLLLSLVASFIVAAPTANQGFLINVEQAKKFAPVVYYSPWERYFPCAIEHIASSSVLRHLTNKSFALTHPTQAQLAKYSDTDYYLDVPDDENVYKGQALVDNKIKAPMYVAAQEHSDHITISYMFLHSNQGSQVVELHSLGGTIEIVLNDYGSHQGDLEHIEVNVAKDLSKILSVMYTHHGESETYDVSKVPLENGHPVVHSAFNDHGSWNSLAHTGDTITTYEKKIPGGTWIKTLDVLSDKGKTGAEWRPWENQNGLVLVGIDDNGNAIGDQTWVTYSGHLGHPKTNKYTKPTKLSGAKVSKTEKALIDSIMVVAKSQIPSEYSDGGAPSGMGNRDFVKGLHK